MRIDPRVSVEKFAKECLILANARAALEERGIFVLGDPEYPLIDALFVPRNSLMAGTALAIQEGQQVDLVDMSALTGRAFVARLDLTDYDISAPSVQFLDPWTRDFLPYDLLVRGQEYNASRGAHLVILPDHPNTHRPFLCLRGVREYHDHPQHSGDDWMLYRGSINVFSLLQTIWRVNVDLVRPMLVVTPRFGHLQWLITEKP